MPASWVRTGALPSLTAEQQLLLNHETVERVCGRRFADADAAALRRALRASLRTVLTEAGLRHPRFATATRQLSAEGAARLGLAPGPDARRPGQAFTP